LEVPHARKEGVVAYMTEFRLANDVAADFADKVGEMIESTLLE